MGCLFLEIMKEEEKEGARSSSCNFLLSVIVFGMFLLFLFVLMGHLHSVLDFCVRQKWPAQHTAWMCCWDPLAKLKVKMRQLQQQGHLGDHRVQVTAREAEVTQGELLFKTDI